PHYSGRGTIPDRDFFYSLIDDYRHSPQPSVGAGGPLLLFAAQLDAERAEGAVLFRWHVAADRGGRRHGHGAAGRSATDHAALRRFFTAQRAGSRTARLVNGSCYGSQKSKREAWGPA